MIPGSCRSRALPIGRAQLVLILLFVPIHVHSGHVFVLDLLRGTETRRLAAIVDPPIRAVASMSSQAMTFPVCTRTPGRESPSPWFRSPYTTRPTRPSPPTKLFFSVTSAASGSASGSTSITIYSPGSGKVHQSLLGDSCEPPGGC